MFAHQKMALGVGDTEVEFIKNRYNEFKELFPYLELWDKEKLKELEPKLVYTDKEQTKERPENIIAMGAQGEYTTVDFGKMTEELAKQAQKSDTSKVTDIFYTDLAALIETALEDDKAEDISVIDLVGKTSIADTMIIASGRSARQVGAMAEHLVEKLKKVGILATIEGKTTCDWVLVDAGDIVVHLFRPEVRAFYNLEKMWKGDAAMPTPMGALGKPDAPVYAALGG